MNRDTKIKPVAIRLSQWGSATEIIYACPMCKTNFAILGHKEKYCHECGQKLDWSVIVKGNAELRELFFSKHGMHDLGVQQRLMGEINYLNNRIPLDNVPKILTNEYEVSCKNDISQKVANNKDIQIFGGMFAKDGCDSPYNCRDCQNNVCYYSGKKVSAYCDCFSAVDTKEG